MALASVKKSLSGTPGEHRRMWEAHEEYTREGGVTVYNSTGAAVTFTDPKQMMGLPVGFYSGNWRLLNAAAVGSADGFIFNAESPQVAVANNAALSGRFVIVARGPAVVVDKALAQVDAANAAIDAATFAAALAGCNPPIIVRPTIA